MITAVATVEQAQKILSGTLVFGDDTQIRAVRFLQTVQECAEILRKCPHGGLVIADCDACAGTGLHECECGDNHDCAKCDGVGELVLHAGIEMCHCADGFSGGHIKEAIRWRYKMECSPTGVCLAGSADLT